MCGRASFRGLVLEQSQHWLDYDAKCKVSEK